MMHPNFTQIRRQYVLDTTEHYAIDTFPGGWQSTAYRVMILGTLLDLYDAWDPEDLKTLPTLTRLKQTIASLGLTGSRLIDDFVRRLVQTGHVSLDRFEMDGRVRILRPSDSTLAWYGKTAASYYSILDYLYPGFGYSVASSDNSSFMKHQRISASGIFEIIVRFLAKNVDLYPFHSMNGGGIALMHLAVSREGVKNQDEDERYSIFCSAGTVSQGRISATFCSQPKRATSCRDLASMAKSLN
ncbi:hypothetical protein [Methylobacterium radiodurans]|uniref:hypothetical protein n=1 Tax=Methylobacterium radiodurans TaxID=2202828 RepID=UPI0013A561DD|nr:hypothetical protein [Methylobacterium radiodurans]